MAAMSVEKKNPPSDQKRCFRSNIMSMSRVIKTQNNYRSRGRWGGGRGGHEFVSIGNSNEGTWAAPSRCMQMTPELEVLVPVSGFFEGHLTMDAGHVSRAGNPGASFFTRRGDSVCHRRGCQPRRIQI